LANSDSKGRLWRHRDFLRLWTAQTISEFGAWITRTGLPLAAVLTVSATPAQLGVLAALATGPGVIVALAAGGFIDRISRRAILIGSDLARAVILMLVPLAALAHLLSMPLLYVAAALVGAANVLFSIADHAYLPSLVAREDLLEGNSKLGVTQSIAEIGGPAIAGVLFQILSGPLAIAANAATYILSAIFLGTIRAPESVSASGKTRTTWLSDLGAGFSAIWSRPLLRPIFAMVVLTGFFGAFFAALYMVYAVRVLGLTPAMLGITIAVGGAGALVGAAAAVPVARALGAGPAIVLAGFGWSIATLLIPLAGGGAVISMAVLMVAQFFGDGLAIVAIVTATSLRQAIVPRDVIGRTAALFQAASGAMVVVGALVGGSLAGLIGVRETAMVAAIGYFVAPTIALLSPLRKLKEIPR